MIEVRSEASNKDGFLWVGHGVGNTAGKAKANALTRIPKGYTLRSSVVTRGDVEAADIHPDWKDESPAPELYDAPEVGAEV